jgi:predicted nucleotide-binding protein
MALVPEDRLTTVSEFRDVIDSIARGGIIVSGAYERLRRELLSDSELTDFMPDWLRATRTSDEFKDLLYRQGGDRVRFVQDSMEPALSYLEAFEFAPRSTQTQQSFVTSAPVMPNDGLRQLQDITRRDQLVRRGRSGLHGIEPETPARQEPATVPITKHASETRVFIVHGRDNVRRAALARFVERLGMQAVILAEQADQGRTIIEKFEDHGNDADYAIVLMTPDDFGAIQGANPTPRARQNVVLELGYFMGRLGRRKVSALIVGEVERPSDVEGVLYVRWDDDDAWQRLVGRNMKASGLDVDMNRL